MQGLQAGPGGAGSAVSAFWEAKACSRSVWATQQDLLTTEKVEQGWECSSVAGHLGPQYHSKNRHSVSLRLKLPISSVSEPPQCCCPPWVQDSIPSVLYAAYPDPPRTAFQSRTPEQNRKCLFGVLFSSNLRIHTGNCHVHSWQPKVFISTI